MRNALPVLLALILAACGSSGGTTSSTQPPSSTPATQPPSSSQPASHQVTVWFLDGDAPGSVLLDAPRTVAPARQALELLLAGPPSADLQTAIPAATTLVRVANDAGLLTVDFSADFAKGSDTDAATGQVARTMLEIPTVKWVRIRSGGEDVFGLLDDQILASPDRSDHPPNIDLLRATAKGDEVLYLGTADVFEATVQVRVVADGATLASETTTASCGTGCRGVFKGSLTVPNLPAGAVLEAYSVSAADGSEQDLVQIPISG